MKVIDVRECKVKSILSMKNGIDLIGWGSLKISFSLKVMFQAQYNCIIEYNRYNKIISESFMWI